MPVKKTKKQIIPIEDLSPKSLPGERWKDIRGYEGYYKISSFGRIKSVARMVVKRWDKEVLQPGRIRKLHLTEQRNKTIDAPIYSVTIDLRKDGSQRVYSVGRLVFDTFVQRIDLDDKNIFIGLKDKDGRNLHYKNLYQSTISELKLEAYAAKRASSHLSVLSKPVTRYTAKGEPDAWYPSMYDAARKTGLSVALISDAANGGIIVGAGHFWRFGHQKKKLDLDTIQKTGYDDRPVHTELMKKLHIRKKEIEDGVPAFLDLSPAARKGERWKDLPGYEGRYMISSFGRVKTLPGISEGANKKFRQARIKMLVTDIRLNEKGKRLPGTLLVSLAAKPQKKKVASVARFVYYAFVSPFDLDDKSLRIYYKDNNPLNAHYKNLELHNAAWSINK